MKKLFTTLFTISLISSTAYCDPYIQVMEYTDGSPCNGSQNVYLINNDNIAYNVVINEHRDEGNISDDRTITQRVEPHQKIFIGKTRVDCGPIQYWSYQIVSYN
jgi:hypothetical protein